MDIYIKMTSTL